MVDCSGKDEEMNLIEQLIQEGKKEELIELFATMQQEMRELNSDKMKLMEKVQKLERKVRYWHRMALEGKQDF